MITVIRYFEIPNGYHLKIASKYANATYAWLQGHPKKKLFMGSGLIFNWSWLKSHRIRGMQLTLGTLIALYDRNNCMFITWGGAVRNLLLQDQPIPVHAEISCTLERIYKICNLRFTSKFCHKSADSSYLIVGDLFADKSSLPGETISEPVRLYPQNSVSNRNLSQWDYTANALAIFDNLAGEVFLIDLTGNGFVDTCGKKIQTTVEPVSWVTEWNQEDSLYKVLSFYELLSYDLISDTSQQSFISNEVMRLFSEEEFQKFYCETMLEGMFFPRDRTTNHSNGIYCFRGFYRFDELSRRLAKFNAALVNDFEGTLLTDMRSAITNIAPVHGRLPSYKSNGFVNDTSDFVNEGDPKQYNGDETGIWEMYTPTTSSSTSPSKLSTSTDRATTKTTTTVQNLMPAIAHSAENENDDEIIKAKFFPQPKRNIYRPPSALPFIRIKMADWDNEDWD
ncbi:hypothetical protein Ddc_04796 [Ditylenchus destructor]|nr:hypothetical protein Ddc_04796 [Ditylenchus destructor]